MAKYKLIALTVSGLGNRVHQKEDNEILTDSHWPAGRAAELVRQKFIGLVNDKGEFITAPPMEPPAVRKKPIKPNTDPPGSAGKGSMGKGNPDPKKSTPAGGTEGDKPTPPGDIDTPMELTEALTNKMIRERLTLKKVSFRPNESRANLYKMYTETFRKADGTLGDAQKNGGGENKPTGPRSFEEINVAELEAHLYSKSVEFDPTAEKSDLYELYKATF